MSNVPTSSTSSTIERAITEDLRAHIEDHLVVSAIRDGKLVSVRWNELTPDERRDAEVVTFHLYSQEVA